MSESSYASHADRVAQKEKSSWLLTWRDAPNSRAVFQGPLQKHDEVRAVVEVQVDVGNGTTKHQGRIQLTAGSPKKNAKFERTSSRLGMIRAGCTVAILSVSGKW